MRTQTKLGFVALASIFAASAQPAAAVCENVTPQVRAESKFLTGPGNCNGEVGMWLTNDTSVRVVCQYSLQNRDGTWGDGMTGVLPGRTVGGESGGVWTCGGTGRYVYYCASQPNWQSDYLCRYPRLH